MPGGLTRLILRLMPEKTREKAIAESKQWTVECEACGHETNVADLGGIRYGAKGEKRAKINCPGCHTKQWARIYRREPTGES